MRNIYEDYKQQEIKDVQEIEQRIAKRLIIVATTISVLGSLFCILINAGIITR